MTSLDDEIDLTRQRGRDTVGGAASRPQNPAWSACASAVVGRLPGLDRFHRNEAQVRNHAAVRESIDGPAFRLVPSELRRRAQQHADDAITARVAPHPAPVAVDDQLVVDVPVVGPPVLGVPGVRMPGV